MSTRKSLHIGLNRVDPAGYNGWSGELAGCINDANAMQEIAESRGFTTTQLIDEQATVARVRDELIAAAAELKDGDFFFLTYSGHGGQVPDVNGDEDDHYDETWCLYDTELVDDSLYGALCTFAKGVRIFVMSDSCHSGTVTRERPKAPVSRRPGATPKGAPLSVTKAEFAAHRDAYAAQSTWWTPKSAPTDAKAKVVLISGCRDDQTSMDGPGNGAFTYAFLQVWKDNGDDYPKGYADLQKAVSAAMNDPGQRPCIFSYGAGVAEMLAQRPFSDEDAKAPVPSSA